MLKIREFLTQSRRVPPPTTPYYRWHISENKKIIQLVLVYEESNGVSHVCFREPDPRLTTQVATKSFFTNQEMVKYFESLE